MGGQKPPFLLIQKYNMALNVSLSYSERNDNKVLTITDTTTNYDSDGNMAVDQITSLLLNVTIITSDNSELECDTIDLIDIFGSVVLQEDLVFPINTSHLIWNGSALGTAESTLPDGIYTFQYVIDSSLPTEVSYTEDVLIEGVIRTQVYSMLRDLPTIYNCKECKTKQIMDTIFCYGLLNTMEAAGYVAKNEELINQLYTLERLTTNGSSYSW
jgi:hypothetical protein